MYSYAVLKFIFLKTSKTNFCFLPILLAKGLHFIFQKTHQKVIRIIIKLKASLQYRATCTYTYFHFILIPSFLPPILIQTFSSLCSPSLDQRI